MPQRSLAGSRIRQMRLNKGVAQGALAQVVGISASYLNLIEHNRRRIGGSLLVALARELGVEATALSEGAQGQLLEAMGQAAAGHPSIETERDQVQDMAGRFPGWAALIAAQQRRLQRLERDVEALVDRLTHDPQLAASIHEMLSVVTAIRSTAGILAGGEALEPTWLARFHRNLLEDAKRLAGNAQALVAQLDAGEGEAGAGPSLPKEELESWLSVRKFHIEALEGDAVVSVDELLAREDKLTSSATLKQYARNYLERYLRDAKAVPMARLKAVWAEPDFDPLKYALDIGSDLPCVMRRLACLPTQTAAIGLVICDGSGTLTFAKPLAGFALPRFGAACPLWPLYQALSRPGVPIRAVVEQSGRDALRFVTYAVAQPISAPKYAAAPVYEATMLILPGEDGGDVDAEVQPVGSSCRICAREPCPGRREPSILTAGF